MDTQKRKHLSLLSLLFVAVIFFVTQSAGLGCQEEVGPSSDRQWTTIFVHGSNVLSAVLLPRSIDLATPSPIRFLKCGPVGLFKVEQSGKHLISKAVKALSQSSQEKFPIDSCYTFGWDGRLDPDHRREEARKLYHEISAELKRIGVNQNIRFIGHSHGCTMCLMLAEVAGDSPEFIIDELILLAPPVHEDVKNLIGAPIFKRVISMYSKVDFTQVADPQWLYRFKRNLRNGSSVFGAAKEACPKKFFSERVFPEHENLLQVNVTINRSFLLRLVSGLSHGEFIFAPFMRKLPAILEQCSGYFGYGNVHISRGGDVSFTLLNEDGPRPSAVAFLQQA